jgi:hypothetical protein
MFDFERVQAADQRAGIASPCRNVSRRDVQRGPVARPALSDLDCARFRYFTNWKSAVWLAPSPRSRLSVLHDDA